MMSGFAVPSVGESPTPTFADKDSTAFAGDIIGGTGRESLAYADLDRIVDRGTTAAQAADEASRIDLNALLAEGERMNAYYRTEAGKYYQMMAAVGNKRWFNPYLGAFEEYVEPAVVAPPVPLSGISPASLFSGVELATEKALNSIKSDFLSNEFEIGYRGGRAVTAGLNPDATFSGETERLDVALGKRDELEGDNIIQKVAGAVAGFVPFAIGGIAGLGAPVDYVVREAVTGIKANVKNEPGLMAQNELSRGQAFLDTTPLEYASADPAKDYLDDVRAPSRRPRSDVPASPDPQDAADGEGDGYHDPSTLGWQLESPEAGDGDRGDAVPSLPDGHGLTTWRPALQPFLPSSPPSLPSTFDPSSGLAVAAGATVIGAGAAAGVAAASAPLPGAPMTNILGAASGVLGTVVDAAKANPGAATAIGVGTVVLGAAGADLARGDDSAIRRTVTRARSSKSSKKKTKSKSTRKASSSRKPMKRAAKGKARVAPKSKKGKREDRRGVTRSTYRGQPVHTYKGRHYVVRQRAEKLPSGHVMAKGTWKYINS